MHGLHPEGAALGPYMHSLGSKDPSASMSTPINIHLGTSNQQAREERTANEVVNNELGHYLR